ncbi:TAT-variant-translocated molybdopterin oxidoreductase [Acidicapsa dinghuensis]|uniref:TAT-variant-translocated molybdopterin oxidoreductase n=1 Tax=Acidicapsa dinghuensis TaxID=2218256 RepID=A0ABW1EJW2_9BACT|nr:TAT-variant-translocated molybdopterin oxidoreductase [Acidicapsa dinghuensis]
MSSEAGKSNMQQDPNGNGMTAVAEANAGLTLAEVRERLKGVKGKKYWRSIDELAGTPEFEAAVAKEFPDQASEWIDPVSRRGFMKLMGASMALAGLAGCTKQPEEPIYPYVKAPEDLILGKPNYFATAMPFPTGGVPLLVKSDAYRPIKVDGNPDHSYNQGSSDVFSQGSLMDMYDPDRSQRATVRGNVADWADFYEAYREKLLASKGNGGEGLYFLTSAITSPTLERQWSEAQKAYPKAKLVQYEPALAGTAFAKGFNPQYSLDKADVIVSIDADFLSGAAYPGFHKLVRDYAKRRKLADGDRTMNRLYAIESTPTTTGMKAEHRLVLRASEIPAFAADLAAAVGGNGASPSGYSWTEEQTKFLNALAKDLKASGGKSVVIPGLYQDPSVSFFAQGINVALGNVGKTVAYGTVAGQASPSDQVADLKSLVADLNAGKVDWLIMLNTNPLYDAPADLEFKSAMNNAKMTVHLGLLPGETGAEAIWHLPAAHYLESWSDVRSYDGTVSIVQPLIEPLYGGRTTHDFFQAMLDEPMVSAYEAVRATWKADLSKGGDFEQNWRKALHAGWIDGTAYTPGTTPTALAAAKAPQPVSKDTFEIIFRPDTNVYDGRYANVGWLQELPRPITSLSWDNAALVSAATLTKLGVEEGDILEITANGRKVKTPVLVAPGHPENSATLYLGYGRQEGRVAGGAGFDAYLLRTSDALHYTTGTVKKVDGKWGLAVTKSHYQDHRGKLAGGRGDGNYSLEWNEADIRGVIRAATLEEFKADPNFANQDTDERSIDHKDATLFPNWQYNGNAWGMSIDMNSCTGCNACIVSCYAENNIAVVGKQQVRIGRNMQWLRIDTYFEGDLSAPRAHFQPMMCQHCENAPCEEVCPVGATVHTPEGLNTMVYNRCVGTRYCSNNCPYKVRRFNYLLYSDFETESLKLMRNPDVSVRSRGVMEKCSYCVQRIQEVKITADKENRAIKDGEIVTACQQACPSQAITFGNINDPGSRVKKLRDDSRSYSLLADINTRPRTKYVAEVLNPNSELAEAPVEHAG